MDHLFLKGVLLRERPCAGCGHLFEFIWRRRHATNLWEAFIDALESTEYADLVVFIKMGFLHSLINFITGVVGKDLVCSIKTPSYFIIIAWIFRQW
jgi:hypothetical protein